MTKKSIFITLASLIVVIGLFIVIGGRTSCDVHIEHTFNAPIEKVWATWNDPEAIKKWWGPHGYSAPVVENDLREGGRFLLSMKGSDEKIIYNSGTYMEVVPKQKIVSEMSFANESGQMVPASRYDLPGKWPDFVTVAVEFKDLGEGKTLVRVKETGIPSLLYVFSKMGWNQQFEKFETLL